MWWNTLHILHNSLVAKILQNTSLIFQNGPICKRNVHTSGHFCYYRKWCIMGYLSEAFWYSWDGSINASFSDHLLMFWKLNIPNMPQRLKSPATRLFFQRCVNVDNKENSSTPHYWPFVIGSCWLSADFPTRDHDAEWVSMPWHLHERDHLVAFSLMSYQIVGSFPFAIWTFYI